MRIFAIETSFFAIETSFFAIETSFFAIEMSFFAIEVSIGIFKLNLDLQKKYRKISIVQSNNFHFIGQKFYWLTELIMRVIVVHCEKFSFCIFYNERV